MSKIGKKPISTNPNISVAITDTQIEIKGPNGTGKLEIPKGIKVKQEGELLIVTCHKTDKKTNALYGLIRSLIANYVLGVEKLWEKILEIHGVGYKVKQEGEKLVFNVGYSHPVYFEANNEVKLEVKGKKIIVKGINKQLVGEIAAKIKAIKKPDKYKGKGLRYEGEILKLKPGKKAKVGA